MFEKYHFTSLSDIKQKASEIGASIPLSQKIDLLREPIQAGSRKINNRIAIQPMEGCDGTPDGKPGALTRRRYQRLAAGGAGLIWFEATAVSDSGRAGPRQLLICKDNLDSLKRLVSEMKETAAKESGAIPIVICQLTHSGRYSKPGGPPAPLIMDHHGLFEKQQPLTDDRILSDDQLARIEETFGTAAGLAEKAGFDGADIKCCHGYLFNEALSAFSRKGRYGGPFENRIRLYTNAVRNAIASTSGGVLITSRLSIYDGFPRPYGFGADESGMLCMEEPLRLIDILTGELKMPMLNITMGNPYQNPHVNRPYNQGPYIPGEHPLTGISRILIGTKQIKTAHPDTVIVGSGYSYLREYSHFLAAGSVKNGIADIIGFGRMAFAYPDFPKDMLKDNLSRHKVCIACGKCSQLMRAGMAAGCVVRDKEIYSLEDRKESGQ